MDGSGLESGSDVGGSAVVSSGLTPSLALSGPAAVDESNSSVAGLRVEPETSCRTSGELVVMLSGLLSVLGPEVVSSVTEANVDEPGVVVSWEFSSSSIKSFTLVGLTSGVSEGEISVSVSVAPDEAVGSVCGSEVDEGSRTP